MAYATASQVQYYSGLQSAFSTSSNPTLAQVNSDLDTVSAEIDVTLSMAGISTVTDATQLAYIAGLCAKAVAANIMLSKTGASAEGSSVGQTWRAQYEKFLDDIRTGKFKLAGTSCMAGNQVSNGTYEEDDLDTVENVGDLQY